MTHTTPTAITLTGADIAFLRRLIETHPTGDDRLQDVLDEHYAAAEHDRPSRDDDDEDVVDPRIGAPDWFDGVGRALVHSVERREAEQRERDEAAAERRARYGTLPTL